MPYRIFTLMLVLSALLCANIAAFAEDADTYYIEVDIASQITTVYRAADGSIARQMICSTGTGNSTPRGVFNLARSREADRREWYYISEYRCFVKYPTRIQGHILFHSLPYTEKDMNSVDLQAAEQLGVKASHGCVRLRWEDAEWIASNCPDGTLTRIYTGTSQKNALRELLLQKSYIGTDGASYDDFIAPIRMTDSAVILRLGASSEAVRDLQHNLRSLGYFTGPVTGLFDTHTAVAIMRYQSASNLAVTGVATKSMIQSLQNDKAHAADAF